MAFPHLRQHKKTPKILIHQGLSVFFFCVKSGIFRGFTPYRTPYRIFGGIFRGYLVGDFLKIGLHSVRALLFHFLRNMAVHIKGEAGRGVAEVLLDGLYIVPLLK